MMAHLLSLTTSSLPLSSSSMFGDQRHMVLHYYLADDTVDLLEKIPQNSGRDAIPVFLRRARLPKVRTADLQDHSVCVRGAVYPAWNVLTYCIVVRCGLWYSHFLRSLYSPSARPLVCVCVQEVVDLNQPGVETKRTVLNVFGPMGHGGRYILDSLKVRSTYTRSH